MVVVYVRYQLPICRATELATYSICNGPFSSRTVRFFNGRVYFLPSYNKTRQITEENKLIARFLNTTVSKIILTDILIVRPFISKLFSCLFHGDSRIYLKNLFILDCKTLDSKQISQIFKKLFAKYGNAFITFSEWRDIAKYYGNVINISRLENAICDSESPIELNFNQQAGHGDKIANKYYGITLNESSIMREHQLAKFKFISDTWFNSIFKCNTVNAIQKPEAALNMNSVQSSFLEANCDKKSQSNEISLSLLQSIYGKDASFKSLEQEMAVNHVLFKNRDLLYISGTGSGKSLLFFLQCLSSKSQSVLIIVPLLSLIDDISERFLSIGLSVCTSIYQYHSQNAIILTPEKTMDANFTNFITQVYLSGQLSRIFIDEAHLISTDSGYRDSLLSMRFLRVVPVPLISLTATAPNWIVNDIVEKIYNNIAPEIIRCKTNRWNIKYSIVHEKSTEKLLNVLNECLDTCSKCDRIIIYFISIRELELFEGILNSCCFRYATYYSELSTEEKGINFSNWKSGNVNVMLATSSFGLGIDYASVKYVLLYGVPYSLEDYIQQSGRAGRNDKESCSLLFYNGMVESRRLSFIACKNGTDSIEYKNLQRAINFVKNNSVCMRKLISTYIDNCEIQCSDFPNCSLCDICCKKVNGIRSQTNEEQNNIILEKQVQITQSNINANRIFAVKLKSLLEIFKYNCIICYIKEGILVEHTETECNYIYKRCTKCFQREHAARHCKLPFVQVNWLCNSCRLPDSFGSEIFHVTDFGVDCYKGILENFGAALFEFERSFIQFDFDFKTYWFWLFKKCDCKIINLCSLFVKFGEKSGIV